MKLMSSKNSVVWFACVVYKYSWSKFFRLCMILFALAILKKFPIQEQKDKLTLDPLDELLFQA